MPCDPPFLLQVKKTQGELLAMRKQCREQKKAIEAHQQELQSLLATAAGLDREYLQRKSALDVVARRRRCEEVNLQDYELTVNQQRALRHSCVVLDAPLALTGSCCPTVVN